MLQKKSPCLISFSAWILIQALLFSQISSATNLGGSVLLSGGPTFVYAEQSPKDHLRVEEPVHSSGLEELQKGLTSATRAQKVTTSGLEELTPSKLIEGWKTFSPSDKKRLAGQLRYAVSKKILPHLVWYAKNAFNPPLTLYEILSTATRRTISDIQKTVQALDSSAYQPPESTLIGESVNFVWEPTVVRQLLENTIIVVAAGGGGARFKRSLWTQFRDQLRRLGRLEKPTVLIGPSGISPIVQTLEEVSELARLVGARGVQIIVVASADSREAVSKDILENNRGFDADRLTVRVTQQATFPSFNPTTGKVLTTINPVSGRRELLKNPNGTYGTFEAGYRFAERRGIEKGKSWLILYGDDPILNTGEFIARVLTAGSDLDVAPIATSKISRTSPAGGTLVDLQLPGERLLHLIIEKAEREEDTAKQIVGLPALNRLEDELTKQPGGDPFGFNTGVLKLSGRAAKEAFLLKPPLRHADRERDDLPGQPRRNLELFAPHIVTLVGSRPGMRYGVLKVDPAQYGAAKDYAAVVKAVQSRNERSRKKLEQFLEQSSVSVEIDPQIYLDVRPGFRGFTGTGRIQLTGRMGAIFSSAGLTIVPITGADSKTHFPLFQDPSDGKLLLKSSPDGRIAITGDRVMSASAGLKEWVGQVDWRKWNEITDPNEWLIQSFSGVRAKAGQNVTVPVDEPLPDVELSPGYKLVFGRYGYLFGLHQMGKIQRQTGQNQFVFVVSRDPRPSGRAIIEAQMRGIVVAARELGVQVRFVDAGVLPTPFAEALVRMLNADGGVIATASHNPLIWNGVKYPTAAKEPGGALVQGGILLPAQQMSGVVKSFQQWAREEARENSARTQVFIQALNQVKLAGSVRTVSRNKILAYVVTEARQMWNLEDENVFQAFKQEAKKIKIVVDPNGGASTGYYADFLKAFGFTVIEINNQVGQPQHLIEPVGEALTSAKQALIEHKAYFAIVMDYDADRANFLIYDSQTGEVIEPNPQEVATMNVAMTLARARLLKGPADQRQLAIVVHDATSRRAWKVAEVFGAKVVVVEVGEVNVLQRMRELERDGYQVVIGVEGANGGSVFRGDHSTVHGDTSRNGAMTGLFTGMLLVNPEIGHRWLVERNSAVPANTPKVSTPFVPTLRELLESLPGERARGDWYFVTPIWKQGKPAEVPEALVIPFRRAMEQDWYATIWPRLHKRGLRFSDGTFQKFSNFQIIYHVEGKESKAYGPNQKPGKRLDQWGMAGWTLELQRPDGAWVAFIWDRGSLTEGLLRVSTEGQGDKAEMIANALRHLFERKMYPKALKAAAAAAGLEETTTAFRSPVTLENAGTVPFTATSILKQEFSQAGLEEAVVIHPFQGFTTKVSHVIADTQVQVAKREVGHLVAQGSLNFTTATLANIQTSAGVSGADQDSIHQVTLWTQQGLQWLASHQSLPVVQRVFQRLQGKNIPVEFRANHAMTLDFAMESQIIRLDTTIATELADPQFDAGRQLLYATGLFHAAALAADLTAREALHLTLGLYAQMDMGQRQHLLQILHSPYIDHGNTWALFFEDATQLSAEDLQQFAGIDSLSLEDQMDQQSDGTVRRRIQTALNHRERWVSWLMGQLLVDLPYDRVAFRKALEKPTVKERRRAAYEVIRRFDRKVEASNAERLSTVVREQWLPETLPYPVLLAGRESRAFGNQAQLFANSSYVLRTKEIVQAAQNLLTVVEGKSFHLALEPLIERAHPSVQEDLRRTVSRLKELLAHLGPGSGRIRQLVFGPGSVTPLTQYEGALQQLLENLEIFYSQSSSVIEQAQREIVKSSTEGVARRIRHTDLPEPFMEIQRALSQFAGKGGSVIDAVNQLETTILQAESYAAAYSVLLQRPSETGSEKFRANELEEKPEQEEVLRKLTRLGGQNLYMSPSYDWVAEATDVIEAAPLFIYERTMEIDGKTITIFEVDQEALEQTIRQMADYWAKNIEKTMDSEHVALAREVVIQDNPVLLTVALSLMQQGLSREAAYRQAFIQTEDPTQRLALTKEIALVAAWLSSEFDRRIEDVEKTVELHWQKNQFIDRLEGLRIVVMGDGKDSLDLQRASQRCLQEARRAEQRLQPQLERFHPIALQRRRPLPAFHLLTTEAPGLVEGFIQTVLEEEMSLRNIVRAYHLETKVRQRMDAYAQRIQTLGWKVIQEFGYEPIVEQYQQGQRLTREEAVRAVFRDHLPLQQELGRLAVLAEMAQVEAGADFQFDSDNPDHPAVEQLLSDGNRCQPLKDRAQEQVWSRNRLDPGLASRADQLKREGVQESRAMARSLQESEVYGQELRDTTRWLARQQILEDLSRRHPHLYLEDRVRRWYRDHTSLAQTTARREVISSEKLEHEKMNPRFAYSSGSLMETKEGKLRPTGGRKRYHLIYAPSRLNLAKGERKSVEVWPQWVGVTDPLAAAHARQFYELINFNPQIRTIKEAENLKVSENQWTAMVRAIRNVQAYFVNRLGVGDIEDLAYQFDQRGGLPVAFTKQGESYQAGPTAGYCIPKDLLFKLFIAIHQDPKKLAQIGLPQHLHSGIMPMMVELAAARENFETSGEWENWAAQELVSPEALRRRFAQANAENLGRYFSQYVEITGGVIVFHLTKLQQLLQFTGVPSPLLARLQDLHTALWSNWAERKLTLPAEEVNRSVVFTMTRTIAEAVEEARRLNPDVDVPALEKALLHFYGTYKGDEDYPSPPDVRYTWIMRAFMVLSGFGKEVALSLDLEGQILARLSWEGFRPDSADPEDVKVTQYLAQQFVGEKEFRAEHQPMVDRLKEAFPNHTTVGAITITVVPGVSSDDLLGFSHETRELLGDVATQVQELLQAYKISVPQMRANAQLRRQFPEKWIPLNGLTTAEQGILRNQIGGKIHPAALHLVGPGEDFPKDIQGQDVVVFSVTHPEIMRLDPAHLRDRMLVGRPNSSLAALDFVAQGRHRVWFDRDIMLWYAACRGVGPDGQLLSRWEERDTKGRRAVYRAFGFGVDEYRPLLGTDLREEVVRQELRARQVFQALERVADATSQELSHAIQYFRTQFAELLNPEEIAIEADLARQYEQQVLLNRRFKPRDQIIRRALEDIVVGLQPEEFREIHWLSIGGIFLLNGAPSAQQEDVLGVIRRAQERLQQAAMTPAGLEEVPISHLIKPQLTPAAMKPLERKGEMFSVKASEGVVERAVARRKALALEAVRLAALAARQEGFKAAVPLESKDQISGGLQDARENLDQILLDVREDLVTPWSIHRRIGVVMGIASQVLHRLADDLVSDANERGRIHGQIDALSQGRELNTKVWTAFCGTYEEHGILSRFFELAGSQDRERVAAAMELLYMTLALDKTSDFLVLPIQDVDQRVLWRALAGFFAETIDDHFYEMNPWAFDPKRGSAFADYYDDLGILKPERAEELYGLNWQHHRSLYRYVRQLILSKTEVGSLSVEDQRNLLGETRCGSTIDQDQLVAQAIGMDVSGKQEGFWRTYTQLREIVFIKNDGFDLPVIFDSFDPNESGILDARYRVNHVFLCWVGRTHYSRALMEAGDLGENVFITGTGTMATVPGSMENVLQIADAHFWLTEAQYLEALIHFKGMSPPEAARQVALDRKNGRLTPKGIRVAARFRHDGKELPVTIGSVVANHHHPLTLELAEAGYPATDKSPVLYDITYDKTLYPEIFGSVLPPEIHWYRKRTLEVSKPQAKDEIAQALKQFAREHRIVVAKGAAESGARNFRRFNIFVGDHWNEVEFRAAVDFIYEVSMGQNVVIQKALIVTPLAWKDAKAVEEFVERQIHDWSVAVELNRHPRSWVYGTLRVILSAGMPKDLNDLYNPNNWEASHWIDLNSLQVATNVGRQGTLEKLRQEIVRPEFREIFIQNLENAARAQMSAIARYGKKYWDKVYVPAYERRYGTQPREFDATGVPYGWPRYLMWDFLPEPIWGRDSKEVVDVQLIDVIPGDSERGTQARFILQDVEGKQFEGQILGFKFWLLEPNVGIGLWPNYWRREEVLERNQAKAEQRPMNWFRVGESDRIVLGNYLAAGEAFLHAKFGEDYFGSGGPHRGTPPTRGSLATNDFPETPPVAAGPFEAALAGLHSDGIREIGPAEASILLAQAAVAAFGPWNSHHPEEMPVLFEQVQGWLRDPSRVQEFPQGEGIDVTREQLQQWLGNETYWQRVAQLAVDQVLSRPLTPPLGIFPGTVSSVDSHRLLPYSSTYAVVVGKMALMNNHLWPWIVGRGNRAVNIIAVYEDWLDSNGRATRFMTQDPQTGRLIECACADPLTIQHAFIVELPQSQEVSIHELIATRLRSNGVHVINPDQIARERADNKAWLREHAPGQIRIPEHRIIHQGISNFQSVLESIPQQTNGLVIQPLFGTTEGQGVRYFAATDREGQIRHIQELLGRGDVLISEYRGTVTYEGRPLVLRFNVAAGEVASVSVVAGPEGSHVASLGQSGEPLLLSEALNGLRDLHSRPVLITDQTWDRLCETARIAAHGIGLPLTGIDLVLETNVSGEVYGVVLEANARPGVLIFGERPVFTEEATGSQSAPPIGSAFWNSLGVPTQKTSLEEPLEGHLRRVSGGLAVRWRPLTSTPSWRRSYDAFVKDYFSHELVPELEQGLSGLLDHLETRSAGKPWTWIDGAGGIGVALHQGRVRYPNLRGVLVDVVNWSEKDIPPKIADWLREEAPGWGIAYEDLWTKKGLQFVQGDLSKLKLNTSERSSVCLVTNFALSFFYDPLKTLIELYNQLPDGGILLALLNVSMTNPENAPLQEAVVRFYEKVVIPDLQKNKIRVDFKKTDRRVSPAVAQGFKEPSPEFQLAFVLVKTPGSISLRLEPKPHVVHTITTRPGEDLVVSYEGDLNKPFDFQSARSEQSVLLQSVQTASPDAGLEEGKATIQQWQGILANPEESGFLATLRARYGDDNDILKDRLEAYRRLIAGALANGFDPQQQVVIVASPGRERIFGGHMDSPGLGGSGINDATQEEILAVLQKTSDGLVHLTNIDTQRFPPTSFPVQEAAQEGKGFNQLIKQEVWPSTQWDSYIRGAAAYLLSAYFAQNHSGTAQRIRAKLDIGGTRSVGVRVHVASTGRLGLPDTGGVSSSSSLTGAFSVGLNALLELGLSLEELAEVDFGEYLLGKPAGASDKAAQLFAQKGQAVVIGSFPERFVRVAEFPEGLAVLMAESPIPRLSTSEGLAWLNKNYSADAQKIYTWADETGKVRFGSRAYIQAVKLLNDALKNRDRIAAVGISESEQRALRRALESGFLRELTSGGRIEQELPDTAGWENRNRRYNLIYRLLKLLPEEEIVEGSRLAIRKAALYGLSEVERIAAYLQELQMAVEADERRDLSEKKRHIDRILNLVRWAHDGDRATVDYRNGFVPTPWAGDPRNDVSDAAVSRWIVENKELFELPGGFERSIPDFDEIANEANTRFAGKVAMRVAAAGLGGTMAIHIDTTDGEDVIGQVTQWLTQKGWKARRVQPGAPTQVMIPPKASGLEEFKMEGATAVATRSMALKGQAVRLENGSWLDARGTGVIDIARGVKIEPNVLLRANEGETLFIGVDSRVVVGARIEGQVRILADSRAAGEILGTREFPTILGMGTQILSRHAEIAPGVILMPVWDAHSILQTIKIYGAQIGDPEKPAPIVIWGGTDVRKGALVRENSVLGPYVHLGPGSEAKATYWMGASRHRNDSTFAHRGYGGNLIGIPIYLDGTPLDDLWHQQLFERLAAFRFGRIASREVQKSAQSEPEIRPREDLIVAFEGQQLPISIRGINFGDGAGSINLRSVSSGRKAIGVISAGVVAGASAKVANPAFVGPESILDDHAKVKRLQAAEPRTYVLPIGTTPERAFRPGAVADFQGKSKGIDEFRLFLANLRTLQTLARVSIAGLKHSQDTSTQEALKAEIRALKGHFDEIDAFTAKELELLGLSGNQSEVQQFTAQAEQLRASWHEIVSAAGLEETTTRFTSPGTLSQQAGLEEQRVSLPAGATVGKVTFLGPDVATPGFIHGLAQIQPAAEEQLGLIVFARDADHKREIEVGLEEGGLTLLEQVINVQTQYGGNLSDAVADRQLAYFVRGTDVHVLLNFAGLEELGRFLQVSSTSWRSWMEQLERQEFAPQA